jgi:hypothetical protein
MKKGSCQVSSFKAMITKYQRKSKGAVIHNNVLLKPDSKYTGRTMQSIVKTASLHIQSKKVKGAKLISRTEGSQVQIQNVKTKNLGCPVPSIRLIKVPWSHFINLCR